MKKRDSYIDVVKGLMMVSVINIHTVYWSLAKHTPDIMRQLAYFIDIPIFFFISGYLLLLSGFIETSKKFLLQFIRLYSHYVIVSLLLFSVLYLWILFTGKQPVPDIAVSLNTIKDVKLHGKLWDYIYGYNGSLWYMRVYFSMILFLPFVVGLRVFPRMRVYFMFFMIILYSLTIYHYKSHIYIFSNYGYITFYSVFFLLGAIFRIEEHKLKQSELLLSFAITCLLCWVIYHFDNNEFRLSHYKFPPTYQYLIYSLPLVHLFAIIKPLWSFVENCFIIDLLKPLAWSGRHSYILYLFQGAVCSLPSYFITFLDGLSNTELYCVVFSFNVSISLLLTWGYTFVFYRAKTLVTKLVSSRKQPSGTDCAPHENGT